MINRLGGAKPEVGSRTVIWSDGLQELTEPVFRPRIKT